MLDEMIMYKFQTNEDMIIVFMGRKAMKKDLI